MLSVVLMRRQCCILMLHPGTAPAPQLPNADGSLVRTFLGHRDRVVTVAANPDSTLVVSASHDGTAKLWDLASATEIRTFDGHVLAGRCGIGVLVSE